MMDPYRAIQLLHDALHVFLYAFYGSVCGGSEGDEDQQRRERESGVTWNERAGTRSGGSFYLGR